MAPFFVIIKKYYRIIDITLRRIIVRTSQKTIFILKRVLNFCRKYLFIVKFIYYPYLGLVLIDRIYDEKTEISNRI